MPFTTLINTAELAAHLNDPDWAIVDARFTLNIPARGENDYGAGHIPGAVYAHLDRDLASPHIPGQTGRHPLPDIAAFAATLGSWGIDDRTQVVAYDDAGGMYAARLWWMLRWLGHDAAAILDGDWRQWQAEGRPVRAGVERRRPRTFVACVRPELVATAAEIEASLGDHSLQLLDARGPDRFRGENETIDPVAGHIPGAVSAPFAANLDASGRLLSPSALCARFAPLLGEAPASESVVYCGSGVSAAHNALAMQHAGLGLPRLYAGSWSDWITDPERPVEK